METLKIGFMTETNQIKGKMFDINSGINIFKLKKNLIQTFYKKENRLLISDLKMTRIVQRKSTESINFFDSKYNNEDAYQLLKKYSNSRIYFEDIRYSINVNIYDKHKTSSKTIPLIFDDNYNNILNTLSVETKLKPDSISIYTKDKKQITPNDDIILLREIGINALTFPIQVNFLYQEKSYEIQINTNQSVSEIKTNVQKHFNIETNKVVFQIDGIIIDDNSKIYDLLILYKRYPLTFDVSLQSEIEKIKKIIDKIQNDEIKKINNENQKLKQTIEKMQKIVQNKDIIIDKKNKEIGKLNSIIEKLKLLKKKKDLIKFDNDTYQKATEHARIGAGGYCTVYKVTKNHEYAMKELNSFDNKDELRRFIHESKFLFELRHPCIIRIHGFNEGNEQTCPSMILSLEPQSLEEAIECKRLRSQIDRCRIAVEIVLGMRYIHSKNVIHRDLKPSNVLLSKNKHVRICDFGISKVDDPNISKTNTTGSLRFMAPELLIGDEKVNYDKKIDVYAFGLVLIYIVTNELPRLALQKVINGALPSITKTTAWVKNLAIKCLSFKPENRPTFNDIFEIMKKHNFNLFSDDINMKFDTTAIKERIEKIDAFEVFHGD